MFTFAEGRLLKEADTNLDEARGVKEILERSGRTVRLTRSDDIGLTLLVSRIS